MAGSLQFPKPVKRKKDSKLMKRIHAENKYKQCEACGKVTGNYAIHHIKKRSQSGNDTEENFAYLHHECHLRLHSSPDQFRKLHGELCYNYLTGNTRYYDCRCGITKNSC